MVSRISWLSECMDDRYKIGLRGKTTLVLGGLIFLALIITSFSNYWQSKSVAEHNVIELEQSEFSVFRHEIESTLNYHQNNLMSLHDVPPIQAIIRARANHGVDPESGDTLEMWRRRLATIFVAFLKNHPDYYQIRYIDVIGDELVRVQAVAEGGVMVVDGDKLQNKSDTLYVNEAIKLKAGEVYYSDVTLNRENGVIQLPHLPVLRLATPVHGSDGQVVALLVINLSTEQLFSGVRSETKGVEINIVDEKGYYIKHADASKTFGLDQGIDYRFQDIEPELAEYAASHDQYFRFHHKHDDELDGFQKIYFSPQDHSRYWLLTLTIPQSVLFADITKTLNTMLFISLFIGLFSMLLIVWFISNKILTPVENLATVASQLQAGNLAVRVDAASAHDEFRTLYAAINAFAENQQLATTELENRVVAQTKRLSAVIDNVLEGIITISEHGTIESYNPAARQIFGYDDEEVIGQNVKMLMPEPYHSEHDDYLEHYNTTGEEKVIGIGREVTGRRKDGTTFPMELAVSEVNIDEARHYVGITRDITERKRIELAHQEFISTVSHELRTPLTSIRGSLGLLLGGRAGEIPDKAMALLTLANNNSERLIHLINDILDIEKIVAGKMEFDYQVINLIPVVQHAVESNKGYADQLHVHFVLNTDPDVEVMVRIDTKRMDQVMSNLLSNAAKYSPTDDQVQISIEVLDDHVRISVHDNGEGIPEEFKARIFSKFAQADSSDTRQQGGTGLGLNITKAIVEQQGGSIGFDSGAGKGTSFYVDLPIWDEESEVKKHSYTTPSDQELLLVVEDDQDVFKQLGILLKKEGYHIHRAFNYQEALQQTQKHKYEIVILSLTIPGGSGISFLRELRNNDATVNLPVIVVSASVNEGKLEANGDAFGMVDWIEKPIDENRLLTSIRSGFFRVPTKGRRLLHVEDDPDIAILIDTLLEDECKVVHAITLKQAKQFVNNEMFDLILLDIGLPDGSGLELLPMLKSQDHHTPVIIFSAQDINPNIAEQIQYSLLKSKTNNQQVLKQIRLALKGSG